MANPVQMEKKTTTKKRKENHRTNFYVIAIVILIKIKRTARGDSGMVPFVSDHDLSLYGKPEIRNLATYFITWSARKERVILS